MKKMIAIDTCLRGLSVAMVNHGKIVSRHIVEHNQQSKLLAGLVADLSMEASLPLSELDAILVTKGPGSFTGIRIGLAFAEGLRAALGAKVLACSTMVCLEGARQQNYLMTIFAVRDLFYVQHFRDSLPNGPISVMSSDELSEIDSATCILGHYKDAALLPSATIMLELASDPHTKAILFSEDLQPLYVKDSYAS